MVEKSLDNSSQSTETIYRFTTFDQLKKALEDNGWEKNKVDRCFSSLPTSLMVPFSERAMTPTELVKYASKLEVAQTRYEQINLLKQVALEGLKAEIIGTTISFENLTDLKNALKERGIVYPKGYLEQPTSSFMNGWGGPRSLSTTSYESMIEKLKAVEDSEEYIRGEIIAKAFNTPVPKSETSTTVSQNITPFIEKGVEVSYPEKSIAFANEIRKATSFPFTVRYSEGGKSYEVPVNVNKNTIIVGGKTFTFTNPEGITIQSVTMDDKNFLVKGSLLITRIESMPKEEFIKNILPKLLILKNSSSITLMGHTVNVAVSGTENPKEIVGRTVSVSNPQKQFQEGVERVDIRDINSIKSGMQKMSPLLTAFEIMSPQDALAAEGSIGSILLARLAASGFRVNIKNDLIQVIPSKPEDQAYATQLETYFQGEQRMNQIFGLGMMYRTSEYKNYASIYLNPDNTVKSGNKRNYIEYLQDAKSKSGSQNMSQEDKDFLASKESISAILKDPTKVDQILLGTKFLTDGSSFLAKNPEILANMNMAALSPQPQTTPASAPVGNNNQAPPSTPSAPQKLPSWEEAPVARALSEIGTGISQGMNQISRTPGAMQGLLIGFALTWFFGGFKKALMFGAGAFGGSALWSSLKKSGVDVGDLAKEGSEALGKGADTVANAASGAKDAVTNQNTNSKSNDNSETPTDLTESQRILTEKVLANTTLKTDIKTYSEAQKKTNGEKTGDLKQYVDFINKQKNITLDKLFPTDHKSSIFAANNLLNISVDTSLNPKIMKRVYRAYFLGSDYDVLTGQNEDVKGVKEKEDFLTKYNITPSDLSKKTVSDLMILVAPAAQPQTPAAQPQTPAAQPQTPAAQPQTPGISLTPLAYVAFKGKEYKTDSPFKIGRDFLVYGDDGKEYNPTNTTALQKDKNGKYFLPKNAVVGLGDTKYILGNTTFVQVRFKKENIYVPVGELTK